MSLTLVIGNRNYSSWSLRAWLYLRESGLEFEEVNISLHVDNWRDEVAKYTSAGRVPVLIDDDITVWDSMAIMAHLLERYPDAVGWPADPMQRAFARSISAEMHSGFLAIRDGLPPTDRLPSKRPSSSRSCRVIAAEHLRPRSPSRQRTTPSFAGRSSHRPPCGAWRRR